MKIISKQRKYEIKQKALNGKLVVLSLFDGISCAQIALKALNVEPAKYYASEIKKKAINVCLENFAETIQVGDVSKWENWLPAILKNNTIDLIFCGSPCQNFSVLGDRKGLDGEKSKLFFCALEILKHIEKEQSKAFYFLFENVVGSEILSSYLSTNVVFIDNAVFDAAHRSRNYFTNINAKFDKNLFDEIYCHSMIPSLTDARPKPFPFDKNPNKSLYLSEKNLNEYYFKFGEPFSESKKIPHIIRHNEVANCITTRSVARFGHNLVAEKCSKSNSYKGIGYAFRQLSIPELKRCNGIPEWFDFGKYSYSSVNELIGDGFGIGSVKYILSHIFIVTNTKKYLLKP